MREFYDGKAKPVKFFKIICFLFLMLLTAPIPSPFYSNHFSFFAHFGTETNNTTTNLPSQDFLQSITKTDFSLIEKKDLTSQTTATGPNKYVLCSGIIIISLFFLMFLFLRIKRTERRFLILKKQNEELSILASNTHNSNEPNHSCLFKAEIPSFRLMDSIFVRTRERMVKIPLKDILYIQAERNYCNLHTREKEFLVVMPLKELYEKLSSVHFLRIHRSFVINLSHIQEIGTGHVVIERKSLPLSKSSKEELLKHLQTF